MRCVRYNNRVCIEAGWMIEAGVLSKANYDQLVLRRKLEVLQRGGNGRPALVVWDSMPERFKQTVIAGWGHPREALKRNRVMELVEPDEKAGEFFYRYTYDGGKHLKPEKMNEYTANAQILNACIKLKKYLMHGKHKEGVEQVWKEISEGVNRLDREDYPHTLPENAQRLEKKVRDYLKEGYVCLIHKGFGNKTAAKVKTDAQNALLLQLLKHKNNLDYELIAKAYNVIAKKMSWEDITGRTVAVHHEKHKMEVDCFRRGIKYFNNEIAVQHRRKAPSHPLYFWTYDGWDAELLYQKTEKDKNDHKVTTYANRPVIVVILDPSVMYPIGYAIGTVENGKLIKAALRNAYDHTKELFGDRYCPHQIQMDNFSSKEVDATNKDIVRIFTPAKVGNAKSKKIEPYFKYLNSNYCITQPNFSGWGILSRKERQPNSDAMNRDKKMFPDFAGVCKQLDLFMEMERMIKRDALMELWADTPEEMRIRLSYDKYLYHYGETTEPNRITGGGLQPRIEGERMRFDSMDIDFRRSISDRFVVKYDPRDLSRVLAINADETKRFMLEPPKIQHMALVDQEEGEAEERLSVATFNKRMLEVLHTKNNNQYELVEELFEKNEALEATLSKFMLTDSRGQHKNRLQAAKGKMVNGELEIGSAKPKKKQPVPVSVDPDRRQEIEEKLYAGIDWDDF